MQFPPAQKSRKRAKDFAPRFRHVAARRDVEDAVELVEHAQLAGNALGMARRTVRENELASIKPRNRLRQLGHVRDRSKVDVMHEVHEDVRLDVMLSHQAGKRRAMLVIKRLLYFPRRDRIEPEQSSG